MPFAYLKIDPAAAVLPTLVNDPGVPRYWPMIWVLFQPGQNAPTTLEKKLRRVEALYRHADDVLGYGVLDDALANVDVDKLCSCLESYYLVLKGLPVSSARDDQWQAALLFVTSVIERITRGAATQEHRVSLNSRLHTIGILHAHLSVSKRRRNEQVRSLPSEVVEALYEMLDPESRQNPFRDGQSRWRVFTLFMLMLHQGLRVSEVLVLSADSISRRFDRNRQSMRSWIPA
jgi:integrase